MSEPDQTSPPAERKTRLQRLMSVSPGDLLRLALISVIVGLILAAFRIDPADLWRDFFGTLSDIWSEFFDIAGSLLRNALQYLLLGAVIVLPIWIVFHIARSLGKRSP